MKALASWSSDEVCPNCGAIYAKVVNAINSPQRRREKPRARWRAGAVVVAASIPVALLAYAWSDSRGTASIAPSTTECASADCLARAQTALASERCRTEVAQAEAPSTVTWGAGPLDGQWIVSAEPNANAQQVAYRSGVAERRERDGSTTRMRYVCRWDVDARSVVRVDGVPI